MAEELPTSHDVSSGIRPQAGSTPSKVSKSIVLLTELYPPAVGGSAVLFYETYRRISGPAVLVVTEAHPAAATSLAADAVEPTRFPHRVGTPDWGILRPGPARHHWRTARLLTQLARERDAVVHCGRALPEGIAAWLARLTGGPRYVCWAHGEDLATARTSRELSFLTTQIYRHASCAIANSRNTARMLQDFGVSAERIAIVYPGVDAERFRPDVSGAETLRGRHADGNEVLLLSVGRLQKRKGHDLVIKALAADRRGLKHVKYVIAGDGEERKALEALAADCGVGDRVTFLGEVSAALLPVYYSACDVFVLPNRIEGGDIEGFGIVFLEAASAGKPVIAGRSGGVPEAVADGQTGILVSGTDPNELAETIRQLAIDASRRRRLGAAGRTRVLESFTWSRSAETLLAAHHKAVGLLVPGRTA